VGSGGGSGDASDNPVDGGGDVVTSQWCDTAMAAPGYTAVALACDQDTPSNIVVQNGIVYWTDYDTGQGIMSVPVAGGATTTLIPNQDYPWALAVDDNNVYWTNYDNQGAITGASTNAGTIVQAPISGTGTPVTLATDLEDPYGIAVDSENVYFTTYGGGRVKKVPIGGDVVTLAEGLNEPCYIAVSGGNVYWTDYGDGTVQTISTSGTGPGTPTTLATDEAGSAANGIAIANGTVFFAANNATASIWSVPTTGGGAATAIVPQQAYPWDVAADSTNVYWSNNDDPGSIAMASQSGSNVVTLAAFLDDPTAIAIDSTGVYTAGDGGHVWRITAN
jgi:hypothetical protein